MTSFPNSCLSLTELSAIFDSSLTDVAREQVAWQQIIPAVETDQIEIIKLAMPHLGPAYIGKAFCWSLRVTNDVGELFPNELEIVRILAPRAPQNIKDNLLYNQAGWAKNYIGMGDYGNAVLFLDRVAANVAAGGDPDYLDTGGLFPSVSTLASQLEHKGYPQLSESIAFGKELAATWSATTNEIPLDGYEKIYKSLQGQSGNHGRVPMEFTC